jgi:hypothetical protein
MDWSSVICVAAALSVTVVSAMPACPNSSRRSLADPDVISLS